MQNKIKQLLKRSGTRYLIVGGTIYAFEIAVIYLAQFMGASPVVAVATSFILGTIISFGLQKIVTFGDKRMHHKVLLPQVIAVTALVVFNFGFTLLVTQVLQNIIPAIICRTVALAITTVWNYYLYRTRIFRAS